MYVEEIREIREITEKVAGLLTSLFFCLLTAARVAMSGLAPCAVPPLVAFIVAGSTGSTRKEEVSRN